MNKKMNKKLKIMNYNEKVETIKKSMSNIERLLFDNFGLSIVYDGQKDYLQNDVKLTFDLKSGRFHESVSNEIIIKYLKNVFSNVERFENRFLNFFKEKIKLEDVPEDAKDYGKIVIVGSADDNKNDGNIYVVNKPEFGVEDGREVDIFETYKSIFSKFSTVFDEFSEMFENATELSYDEAFSIDDSELIIKVFGAIDIPEMINKLGAEKIKVDGKLVKHKQYSKSGEFLGFKEYDVIFETYSVNIKPLINKLVENPWGDDDTAYVVKAWCTSTNEEHYLWIEDEYKNDPLSAIASTFRIHKNIIPYIKEIKRQGDLLFTEMKPEFKTENIKPEGEIVPLTKDQYFGLLTAQS